MQVLTVKDLGGLNKSASRELLQDNEYPVLNNFLGLPNYDSTFLQGVMMKGYSTANFLGANGTVGRSRGMYEYYLDADTSYIMAYNCTTDYTASKLYYYDGAAWKELKAMGSADQADFASYSDKAYIAMGNYVYKWKRFGTDWDAACPVIKDRGVALGSGIALAGTIAMTSASTTLTGAASSFTTELSCGDWVRGDNGDGTAWYEIQSVTNDTAAVLTSAATADYAANTGEKAFNASVSGRFITVWKQKLWIWSDWDSTLYWSATGDMEDFTSDGSDNSIIGDNDYTNVGTGIGTLDDLILFFKNYNYFVYRWTGDVDAPISLLRSWGWGCASERTIQNVGEGIIYYTGNDVRITNGGEDVSIASRQMKEWLRDNASARAKSYFSGVTANAYPWAMVDPTKNLYILTFPGSKRFFFDYVRKIWIGGDDVNDMGSGLAYWSTNGTPVWVHQPVATASGQMMQFDPVRTDYTNTGEIESKTFSAGEHKKMKVYWVEFVLTDCTSSVYVTDSTIGFKYRTDFGALGSEQTYALSNSDSGDDNSNHVKKIRFPVGTSSDYFSWYLKDTPGVSATRSWGLKEWSMGFDILKTS